MNNKLYAAVTVEEGGKLCAYVVPFTSSDNVLSKLHIKGIQFAAVFPTKKAAGETVTAWNTAYKTNGTYLFDTPKF